MQVVVNYLFFVINNFAVTKGIETFEEIYEDIDAEQEH